MFPSEGYDRRFSGVAPALRLEAASLSALEELAVGVAVLGSGGAARSEPLLHELGLRIRDRAIDVFSLDTVGDNDSVVPVGFMGSTTIFGERLPTGQELVHAITSICRNTSASPIAVCGFEIGPINGLSPLFAASLTGLPVIDVDLAGRAVPRLDVLSLVAANAPVVPCALAGPRGVVSIIENGDARSVELIARAVSVAAGGWTAVAFRPLTGRELRSVAIDGSLLRARSIGAALRGAQGGADLEGFATAVGGAVAAVGTVVSREQRSGPDRGFSSFIVRDSDDGVVRIETQSEYVAIVRDGRVVMTTPEIIAILDPRDHRVIGTDLIRVGMEVVVVGLPSSPWWRGGLRAETIGPRAFGMDHDPVPLDDRRVRGPHAAPRSSGAQERNPG